MKIKVIKNKSGYFNMNHVLMIAWTDDMENDVYISRRNNRVAKIKLDYYRHDVAEVTGTIRSLAYANQTEKEQLPEAADNDSVVLHSDVSFSDFCTALRASPFATDSGFDIEKKNCVDSVLFALQAAKIDMPREQASCRYFMCCFWGYTNRITPRILIKRLNMHPANVDNPIITDTPPRASFFIN